MKKFALGILQTKWRKQPGLKNYANRTTLIVLFSTYSGSGAFGSFRYDPCGRPCPWRPLDKWVCSSCLFPNHRGWCIKFATGLNTKIGIVQIACIRVIKLSSCQNDPSMGESFWWKNSLITFILFELFTSILVFSPVANLMHHPLVLSKKI